MFLTVASEVRTKIYSTQMVVERSRKKKERERERRGGGDCHQALEIG